MHQGFKCQVGMGFIMLHQITLQSCCITFINAGNTFLGLIRCTLDQTLQSDLVTALIKYVANIKLNSFCSNSWRCFEWWSWWRQRKPRHKDIKWVYSLYKTCYFKSNCITYVKVFCRKLYCWLDFRTHFVVGNVQLTPGHYFLVPVMKSDKHITCDEEFSDSEDEGDGRRDRTSHKRKKMKTEDGEKKDDKPGIELFLYHWNKHWIVDGILALVFEIQNLNNLFSCFLCADQVLWILISANSVLKSYRWSFTVLGNEYWPLNILWIDG